ncbi:MAG: hypothetical protein ACE5E5_00425 [Phycisphaerae bacterium]
MMLIQGMMLSALVMAVMGQVAPNPEVTPEVVDDASYDQFDRVVKVINTSRALASGLCLKLKALSPRVQCEPLGHNRMVVSGLRGDVDYALNEVLPKLEAPEDTDVKVRSIRLSKYPPGEMLELVRNLATFTTLRVAVDEINRNLIVRGNDEDFAQIQQLVEWVDQPTEALTLHFYFIRATVGGGVGGATGDLPDNLQPIIGTMSANGFSEMSMLATVMIHADEGSHFQQTSTLRSGSGEGADELEIRVGGAARLDANGSAVQLEVRATLVGEGFTGVNERNTQFELETEVALKLNGYAILAAGPGSTADGNALAIVVHVTKN